MAGMQLAGRVLSACLVLILWILPCGAHAATGPKAKWTVMVYMNGDNDLEKFAVADFLEMAEVGSTDQVNVIVQLDRRSKKDYRIGHRRVAPGWTETLRFRVEKGMKPLLANALNRESPAELDMGDPKVLREFVQWAGNNYPADQFALVIWDHGDGFRAVQPEGPGAEPRQERVYRSLEDAAHRAVSHDESNGNVLYNHEVQSALRAALGGKRLAVLGFDACLMGMIEVAFSMRGFADVLVASEELVPGTGWDYADWLRPLVQSPVEYGPEELGKLLVASYEKTYKERDGATTHSAVRLAAVSALADAVSTLGDRLRETLPEELDAVREARGACAIYAPNTDCKGRPCYQNVDLGRFCSELARRSGNPAVVQAANRVLRLLQDGVLANYAGPERGGKWGSTGLAIYFPPDRTTYEEDGIRKEGYDKSNTVYPVEFVQSHRWADFLHAFFQKVN